MKQLTLRQIPSLIEKRLRKLAQERGQSINKTVIYLLKQALGLEKTGKKYRDLSKFTRNWSKEEVDTFIKNTEVFEQIDEEVFNKVKVQQ